MSQRFRGAPDLRGGVVGNVNIGPRDEPARTTELAIVLIERVCAGEKDRFYELISAYERSVYMAAFSVLQNEADAEEDAQEAFLKAFTHLSSFRRESKFSTGLN